MSKLFKSVKRDKKRKRAINDEAAPIHERNLAPFGLGSATGRLPQGSGILNLPERLGG